MAGTIYSDLITTSALPDALRVIYSNELEFTSRPTLVVRRPQPDRRGIALSVMIAASKEFFLNIFRQSLFSKS